MLNPKKILVLEAIPAEVENIRMVLEKSGMNIEVYQVSTKQEFIAAINNYAPDIILSDHELPGLNCLDAIKIYKKHHLHLPFIVVSESFGDELAARVIKQGADDYVLKANLQRLPIAITVALKQREQQAALVQKQAELGGKEDVYRLLFYHAPDVIFYLDEKGNFLQANEAAISLFGYSEADFLRMNMGDLLPPSSDSNILQFIEQLDHSHSVIFEGIYLAKNNEQITVEVNAKKLDNGRMIIVVRDARERKRAEALLVKKEGQYKTLTEIAPNGVFHTDANGYTTYVNPCWSRIAGMPAEQALGNGWLKAVHEEDRKVLLKKWHEATVDHKISHSEYRFTRPDGSIAWVIGQAVPERNAANQVIGYVGTITDITERKEAERDIMNSEMLFRRLASNVPVAIFQTNLEGDCTYVNQEWIKYAGISFENAMGKGWANAIHPEDRERVLQEWEIAVSSAKEFTSIFRFQDNERKSTWLSAKAVTLRDADNNIYGYIGMASDITDNKLAQEQLLQLNKSLEEAEKLAGLGSWNLSIGSGEGKWSKQMFRIFGLEDSFKKPTLEQYLERIHPEDRGHVQEVMANIIRGLDLQPRMFRTNPQILPLKYLLPNYQVERHSDGTPLRFSGTLLDITERITSEKKIEAFRKRSEAAIRIGQMGYWSWDIVNNELYWSERMYEIYDIKKDQPITYDNILSQVHPDDRQYHEEVVAERIRTKSNKPWEYRIQLMDGTTRHVLIQMEVSSDEKGNAIKMEGTVIDITERKKAEEQLNKSEKLYRSLFENMLHGFSYCKAIGNHERLEDFIYLTVNEEYEKILGVDKLKGKKFSELFPGLLKSNQDYAKILTSVAFRGKTIKFEDYFEAIDKWLSITLYSTEKAYFVSLIDDVSDRKKTEALIRESEEKYRSLVEQASEAIFIVDETGRLITVNNSACNLSQYSETELLNMTTRDLTILDDILYDGSCPEALKGDKPVNRERIMKRRDGQQLEVEVTAKLLSDGRILHFVRDISERKRVQNELIKERNLSNSIINSLPGIFYLYNKEGKFLRWNRNFETVSMYSSGEIGNMHPLDFFDDDEKELLSQKIQNVFITGIDNVQANFLLKNKTKIPYYFTGIAITYEGNTCLMGVGIDFSERKKAQEKIVETADQLRQLTAHLQRVREDERKRIGREIHDELGQQLTAIKMDVAWIDKKTTDINSPIKPKLKNILSLVDGSNLSVKKILNELRPGVLDNYGLLEALEWQSGQFSESTGIPVRFKAPETDIKIPEQISTCIFRVYQESLTNIMRYAKAKRVLTSLIYNGDEIAFTIEDDGIGFDYATLRLKRSFGIFGMRERVISLNGKFDLFTEPGKGTKITLRLPGNFITGSN